MEKMKREIFSLLPYTCLTPHPKCFTRCFDWSRGYSLESLFTGGLIGRGPEFNYFQGHSGATCVAKVQSVSKST